MTSTRTAEQLQHAQRVLLAGDASEISAIEAMLALLPAKAYGQVFIEVSSANEIRALHVPRRVNVTWLPCVCQCDATVSNVFERADGNAALSLKHGQALERAARAWLTEWDLGAELDGDAESLVWIGGARGSEPLGLSDSLSQSSAAALHWLGTSES